ncbi:response regulator [Synoicihabitans lomoniglobus]|uniref:Response regulator n=1 Tax=Synoicihabitans lomoniglobus TaxID=2909285 RepID=A0AAF0I6U9_9BACT|nr:response regulator [Opitutaceae bacterium LMO-M01]WED66301.1 response regulator [Opitutaceae bacterium LMO-M01]
MTAASLPHAIIVDDEQSYLDLLSIILGENLACPVATFARPLDALEAMADLDVGIIVTDFYMPDIDGMEFLKRAEQLKPGVPSIMITGHIAALDGRDQGEVKNLKAVLAKPFRAHTLSDKILEFWPQVAR